jgi:hypothetical protein
MKVDDYSTSLGSANELFTLENYMLNAGFLDEISGSTFSLLGYHVSLSYLKDVRRYINSKFH